MEFEKSSDKGIFILFLIFFVPTVSWGQLDTLVISTMTSQDYVSVRNLLHSDKTHKLTINFDDFPPYSTPDQKDQKAPLPTPPTPTSFGQKISLKKIVGNIFVKPNSCAYICNR